MNRQQAIDLVRETFESAFEKTRFVKFVKNLLNKYEPAEINRRGNLIPDAYENYVSRYERVGKYTDSDEKRIDILIVHLKRETSVERARTMQRNFVAGYLQGRYGSNTDKDAALVAFVSPDGDEWRFSLVKLEYKLEAADAGKMKVKDELTPARRWSFLVGTHEKSHTAQTQFVPIMQDTENNPTLAQLEEAFNIEKVTKEFFVKYRELFIRAKEELDKVIKKEVKAKADFARKSVDTVNFAKKLLGQMIFLYFLQKKGWFGVPRDAAWGEGARNFLRELFEKKHGGYKNFFNDILEPLFYEALRIDRSHDDHYYRLFDCKVPFLNGGLFDPMSNYDWVHTDILLPNDLFSNDTLTPEGDRGDGILDIFDRYNFTVKEDEPFEKEVAIDPELLGKAYEKFNAIRPDNYEEYRKALKSGKKGEESKFNKQYGVYYTPREIVHYMCQQSLINYLHTELNPLTVHQKLGDDQLNMFGNTTKKGQMDLSVEHRPMAEVPKEDIETLILRGEQIKEHDARVVAEGRETKDYPFLMPKVIRENVALIDEKLANIRVCDPAVGSGAFPVGMMSEIVRARSVLTVYQTSRVAKTAKNREVSVYDFKRQCIEHSLYGVDIDSGAVEIAKLRLWLSLVVDEDDPQNIKPLPNLDYKIVCGNSLIGFPENWDSPIEKEIESLIHQHFNEINPKKKEHLKNQIDEKIASRYKNSLRTFGYQVSFDFKTVFSEVFQKNSGFDVVIGNPPYVRIQEIDAGIAKVLKNIFEAATGKFDLYVCFIEKGFQLLRKGGSLVYINPNKFFNSTYGNGLRKLIVQHSCLEEIVDFGDSQMFETATTYTCILRLTKIHLTKTVYFRVNSFESFLNFSRSKSGAQSLNHPNTAAEWVFAQSNESKLLENLKVFPNLISQCDEIFQGLISGGDRLFYLSFIKETPEVFIGRSSLDDQNYEFEKELCYPLLKGSEVKRYTSLQHKYFICYPYYLDNDNKTKLIPENTLRSKYPKTYLYLKNFKSTLVSRGSDRMQYESWYALWNSRSLEKFKSQKILTQVLSTRANYTLDDKAESMFVGGGNAGVYGIIPKNDVNIYYLLGLLNSRMLDFILKKISTHFQNEYYSYARRFIEKLPIHIASEEQQKPIIKLVERVLAAKGKNPQADTSKWEREIDVLVYEMYGLTEEEVKVVEGG